MSRYLLTVPGRLSQSVDSYRDASDAYSKARDDSGEGASTFPEGALRCGHHKVARVSYNGRVWEHEAGKPNGGGQLVYCPGSAGQDEGRPDVFNEGRESVWGKARPNPHAATDPLHAVFERGAAFARSCYA